MGNNENLTADSALSRAAAHWRIAPGYVDNFGREHVTSDEVKVAILASLDIHADGPASLAEATEESLLQQWSRPMPMTLVISEHATHLALNMPWDAAGGDAELEFRWEQGHSKRVTIALADLPPGDKVDIRGMSFTQKQVPLPRPMPNGYHQLRVRLGDAAVETCLIVTPDRCWLPERLSSGGSTAGLAVSLYGLRSRRNWGCGDFTDLDELAGWAHEAIGASFLGLNPLHVIANRTPYNTSPYLPLSSFYRNGIYLDIERIPEFMRSKAAQKLREQTQVEEEIRALRESEFVEYERVHRLKTLFLRILYRQFLRDERAESVRGAEFRSWCDHEGQFLERFAVFCALDERIHRRRPDIWIWPDWPEPYHDPESPETAEFARQNRRLIRFYQYVQWQVDQQLEAAQRHVRESGLSIGLYHDLALATDRCGADLWAYRPFYVAGCRVGSPPDVFAPEGQDWSFPPPHADRHCDDGYQLYRETIRRNARHGGALRIDHVMRLFRLFWIPDGMKAKDGAYVRDRAEDLLRILALESTRGRFLVVGEDLGTVESRVREELERFGVLSYRVIFFESDAAGTYRRPEQYPRSAVACSTTHDLPTLAGFWVGRDIEARRAAGLLSDEKAYQYQLIDRASTKQHLLDFLFAGNLLPDWVPRKATDIPELTGELHNAIIGALCQTRSMLMVLNQEDLTKEIDQQNLPGSTWQYPNWRRKMRYTIEELHTDEHARDFSAMLRNWLRQTGRLESS